MGKSTKPAAAPPDTISLHRKLDPIYECVDTGQNKAALKLIGDLLKKYPTLQIARVLKGITLSRMGMEDEGMELCEEVRAEGPADDTVLNTLALFYKNVGAAQQQVEMFEQASERDPRNAEHLTLLFQAYARAYDFVKQQQCAMKLYRLTNNPKHVMWAICAMLMQADANPTALALAAGMCSKLEAKGSIADRESLLVYARVLRESGQGEKALELLEGDLGERLLPMAAERAVLCATQAAALGKTDAAAKHWRALLTHAPDDWAAMSRVLDIAMPTTRAAAAHKPQVPAGGTRMAARSHSVGGAGFAKVSSEGFRSDDETVAELLGRASVKDGPDGARAEAIERGRTVSAEVRAAADALGGALEVGRGAYLLDAEFAWRAAQLGDPESKVGDAMMTYWRDFGTWTSCARDLRPYCDAIRRTNARAAREFSDRFVDAASAMPEPERVVVGGDGAKEARRHFRRVIAAHAIASQLGRCGGSWRVTPGDRDAPFGLARPSLGRGEGRERAAAAMELYRKSKSTFAGTDPREPTPADTAALLAMQALCAEATGHAAVAARGGGGEGVDGSLREAAMLLLAAAAVAEEGVAASPNHAELRLGLTSVYALLGAATAARDAFAPLDVKNIQMDSMIHHVLPIAEGGATPQVTFRVTRFADNLRDEARRDVPDGCVKAYENGIYTKALEFVDFHERLRASHSLAAATVARVRATLRETSCGGGVTVLRETGAPGEGQPAYAGVPGPVMGALDAAAKACQGLLTHTSGMANARYNEDLGTNPVWSPPHHGAAALAVPDWWTVRSSADLLGTGCAVAVAGAHDAGAGGAGASVAHRAGWRAAIRRRCAEVYALHRAAAMTSPDAASPSPGLNVLAAIRAIETLREPGDADAPLAASSAAAALAPVTADADVVSDAMLAALAALLRVCSAGEEDDEDDEDVVDAAASLDGFAAAFASLCARAAAGLRAGVDASGGGGDAAVARAANGAVPFAFYAVADAGVGATAALQSWSAAVRGEGQNRGSGRAAGNPALVAAVRSAAGAAADAIAGVVDAAVRACAGSSEVDDARRVFGALDEWCGPAASSSSGGGAVGSGRLLNSGYAAEAAKKVVASHRSTLGAVRDHGERLVAQLRVVANRGER